MAAQAGKQPQHLVVVCSAVAWGGAEIALGALIRALEPDWRITLVGHDPVVMRRLVDVSGEPELRMVRRVHGRRDVKGWFSHLAAFRALRPDVVLINLHEPWESTPAIIAAMALLRPRLVALEHCPMPTESRSQRVVKRLVSKRLDLHLSVSSAACRSTEELTGLAPGSVQVLPNIVSRPSASALAVPLPPGLARPVIVAAGRMDRVKGFDVLIQALSRSSASLWLLGDGPLYDEHRREVAALGMTDRVVMDGWHERVPDALAVADLVVVPSRAESFGFVAHEALLAGTPVVASRVPGLVELLGDAAAYAEPEDPEDLYKTVERVLDDPGLQDELLVRASVVVAAMPTAEQVAARFRELLGP